MNPTLCGFRWFPERLVFVLIHRRGENTRLKVKTRIPEPFWIFRRSFLCTGAAVSHFVHRRGGFAKLCKTIAPVGENRSSAKLSKTLGNLTVLAEKVRQPRAELPLFLRCPRRRPPKASQTPHPGAGGRGVAFSYIIVVCVIFASKEYNVTYNILADTATSFVRTVRPVPH